MNHYESIVKQNLILIYLDLTHASCVYPTILQNARLKYRESGATHGSSSFLPEEGVRHESAFLGIVHYD